MFLWYYYINVFFYCVDSSPLIEFNIDFYDFLVISKYNISITTLYIQLCILNIFFIVFLIPKKLYLIPNILQFLKERFYLFLIKFFINKNYSIRMIKFVILYFNIFFFILWCNINSLIHYGQSITSQLFITLGLSFILFYGLLIIGFLLYKSFFYKIVYPDDVPKMLIMFIFFIEIFSFFVRPFSLAIRLFSNILAGHLLLLLISMFIIFLCYFWISIIPMFLFTVLVFLVILETIICFIQSYVFLMLFLVYIEQIYSLIEKL